MATSKPNLTWYDYLFMIGGPVAFVLVAVIGVLWILGPALETHPVDQVERGEVVSGMSKEQVRSRLGVPDAISLEGAGNEVWRYSKPAAEMFMMKDARITFSPSGRVSAVSIEEFRPPPDEPSP